MRRITVKAVLVTFAVAAVLTSTSAAAPGPIQGNPASSYGPAASRIGYGVNVGNLDNLDKVQALGFNWVKRTVSWAGTEGSKGVFDWSGLDDAVARAQSRGLKILLRVDEPPQWATGTSAHNAPPRNDQDLADYMYAMASRYRGRIHGYEIWNEPNVASEWANQNPSPIKYGQMLRALYPRVKQADPDAKVVTGGLANTGDGNGSTVYGDLLFIKHLYDPNNNGDLSAGAKGFFDAIGSHPYGGPNSPEVSPWPIPPTGTYFRRAWQHHQMADVWGHEDREIWITESGWLLDPAQLGRNCDAQFGAHFTAFKVSAAAQADYTVRAYQYATANWPFLGPLILFNLDASTDSWRSSCEVVTYYSLLNRDGSPRPVYTALAAMAKPGLLPPALSLDATSVTLLAEPGRNVSQTVNISNLGDGLLNWSASATGGSWLSVSPTSGAGPATPTVSANAAGLANGKYSGSVAVNAPGASPSSSSILVTVFVGPVYRAYAPEVSR